MTGGQIEVGPILAESARGAANDRYSTLDGLRGFSAVIIALHHFWPAAAQSAFFSLDLFFALSGFVLVRTYESRLSKGMTALDFLKRRSIRFLPLYWVGLGLGVLLYLQEVVRHVPNHVPVIDATFAFIPNIFMLPSVTTDLLFPFNMPSWSLFCEFVVNAAFVVWLWKMSTSKLIWLGVFFGLVMVSMVIAHDMALPPALPSSLPRSGFNAGAGWAGWYIGLARATYSFVVGMVVARLENPRGRPKSWLACAAWLALLCIQSLPIPQMYRLAFDLSSGLLLPPLLLLFGTRVDSPIPLEGVARWFGDVSFGLYMVHLPLTFIMGAVRARYHVGIDVMIPIYLIIAVVAGWLATVTIDIPLRKWLTASWVHRAPAK